MAPVLFRKSDKIIHVSLLSVTLERFSVTLVLSVINCSKRVAALNTNHLANDCCVRRQGCGVLVGRRRRGFSRLHCTYFLLCVFWLIHRSYSICQRELPVPLVRLLAIPGVREPPAVLAVMVTLDTQAKKESFE